MITEDYVSFETAKLLKEKGFDGEVQLHYNKLGGKIFSSNPITKNCIKAPTLQMAIKWLREIYNIHIVLSPNKKMNNQYSSIIFVDKEGELYPQPTDFFHGSYKETAEISIKYCLEKLI
jgi:hypothetical protein